MHDTQEIFLKDSKVFSTYRDGFSYKKDTIEKKYMPREEKLKLDEYAMVSYKKGKKENKILFFVSNHDIGCIALVKNFTDLKWLKAFYDKNNLKEDSYYNALFKVNGLRRTEMESELIKLEVIE